MIDLGPLNEVLGVVGETDTGPLPPLGFLRPDPGIPGLDQRTLARLPVRSTTPLIPNVDRVCLHPSNSLLVKVSGPTGKPNRPVSVYVPVHSPWSLVLLPGAPTPGRDCQFVESSVTGTKEESPTVLGAVEPPDFSQVNLEQLQQLILFPTDAFLGLEDLPYVSS